MSGRATSMGAVLMALGLFAPTAILGQTIPQGPPAAPSRPAYSRAASMTNNTSRNTPRDTTNNNAGSNDAAAPRLADLSPQSIGLQPLSGPRAAGGQPAGTVAAPASYNQPAFPSQPGQAGRPGQASQAGQILTPGLIAAQSALAPAATTAAPQAGSVAPNYGSQYGAAAPRTGAGGGEARSAGGVLSPDILQPTILPQPREFAKPGEMLPVLSLNEATILGGPPQPLAAPAVNGGPTGLADNALTPLGTGSLGLTSLAWEDGSGRLADLSPQLIPFGPLGPEAALGGFVPSRVLPWPDLGQRGGAGRIPPQQPSPATGYNPLAYGTSLGLALNSFAQIGAQLGAGLAPSTQLPGLPPIPRY